MWVLSVGMMQSLLMLWYHYTTGFDNSPQSRRSLIHNYDPTIKSVTDTELISHCFI